VEGAERVHPVRLRRCRVRGRFAAERVGDVRGDDPAAGAAGAGEVLLGHHDDVAVRDAFGSDLTVQRPGRVVDEVGLLLGDAVRAALDAAGDDLRAGRLHGAAQGLRERRGRRPIRADLPFPEVPDAARDEGAAMSLDEAVDYASRPG